MILVRVPSRKQNYYEYYRVGNLLQGLTGEVTEERVEESRSTEALELVFGVEC